MYMKYVPSAVWFKKSLLVLFWVFLFILLEQFVTLRSFLNLQKDTPECIGNSYILSTCAVSFQYINPTIFNIIRWVAGTNDSSTKSLMFQVLFFFYNFLQKSLQKSFQFIFLFFYNFSKIKVKSFDCPKYIKNYEKK